MSESKKKGKVLSMRRLAQLCGVSQNSIRNWCYGYKLYKYTGSADTCKGLVYNITPESVLALFNFLKLKNRLTKPIYDEFMNILEK